jgi:hypothetical protein
MRERLWFVVRQVVLVGLGVLAYFAVRGLTEGEVARANRHAQLVLDFERALGIDIELGLQSLLLTSEFMVDLVNWVYIWAHWPVVVATLAWLAIFRRDHFYELRNAMFISGAIGLIIFASFAVAPPRLFSLDYIDTVTERSVSYRVLQPPSLVSKYAAVPSLHFGWNLLVGITWYRVWRGRFGVVAAVGMPIAMAFAVVATGNHWTVDVLAGCIVALAGLYLERVRQRRGLALTGSPRTTDRPLSHGEPTSAPAVDGQRNSIGIDHSQKISNHRHPVGRIRD